MSLKICLIGFAFFLLSACGSHQHYAPVNKQSSHARYTIDGHNDSYVVKAGDTLFSIAWLNNLTVERLAITNGLAVGDIIYPGQRLSLNPLNKAQLKPPKAPSTGANSKTVVTKNNNSGAKTASSKTSARKQPKSQNLDKKITASGKPGAWHWPARGKIIQYFSVRGTINKGIDFQGRLGEPVVAAKSGKVVYSGDGLIGYGKLIIIKHDSQFLSAYGHNNKILVREGEKVKAKQKIAEIGKTGTDRVKLHFEIRKNGKSVDPLKYLPKR